MASAILRALYFISVLPLLALGNPVELQKRGVCYHDNCLRELLRSSAAAGSYCSSAYVVTTTATVATTYVPALGATFPAFKKRDADPEVTAPPPLITPHPELKRQNSPPAFVSKCTEAPSAIQSGCSCLLGTNAPTATVQATYTSTLPLPAACSSQNGYGLVPTQYGIAAIPNGQGSSGLGFEVLPGGCCAYCLASPNCIAYFEETNYVPNDPSKVACSVEIIGGQPIEPLSPNPSCPLGIVSLTVEAGPENTILFGIGSCGIVVG